MTVQTCMAGRNIPIAELLRRIMTSRGHVVDDASNPAECVHFYTRGQNNICKLMIVDYTGPETIEMIHASIDRAHIHPENIAVLSLNGARGAEEVEEYGCLLVKHPFDMSRFIDWVVASERRCARKAA